MNKDKIIELYEYHIEHKDKEIERLKNGFGHGVLVELEELDELKERVEICKENHIRYDIQAIDENTELKAENVQLIDDNNSFHSLFDEVEELKVENERLIDKLQAVNDDYNNDHKVHNEYEDGLLEEVKELKAEVKRGEKQYHLMASSKEYQAEAEEYFSCNPQSKGIRFHMIDFSDYDYDDDDNGLNGGSGEYSGSLYAEDCLIEIDNTEGGS